MYRERNDNYNLGPEEILRSETIIQKNKDEINLLTLKLTNGLQE